MRASLALSLAFACVLALPAWAQDQSDVEVVPAEEPAAEGYEEVPMEESAPADESGDAVAEEPSYEAPADEAPADSGYQQAEAEAVEEEPVEPAEPISVYLGLDQVTSTLSVSSTPAAGAIQYDSGMYRLRAGLRLFEAIGLELQYGLDNSDNDPTSVETADYYGLYLVPTATLFEVAELAFPVGYAKNSFGPSNGPTRDYSSVAFGANIELPLRSFSDGMPDIRLTGGGMVYYQKSDARAYGYNLGLRYDFETTLFSGWGSALGRLWPFGGE